MAEVMEQLDAARDDLLDDNDELVGLVKDVKEVEKRLRHRLLPRNAWRLVPFFDLFMSAPKDELHQWDRFQLFSLDFLTFGFLTFSDFCSEPRGGALVMCAHMHPRHRATEFQIVRQLFH
jgi:hypothetical protein